MIGHYLKGQALLRRLAETYPAFHQHVLGRKVAREQMLRMDSLLRDAPPTELLRTIVDDFQNELMGILPSLQQSDARMLAYEAVSDWLLRCPIEFEFGDAEGLQAS